MAKKFLTPVAPPALASDPASGVAGAIYYNTTSNALKFYNGTTWTAIGTGAGGGGTATGIQALDTAPESPSQGSIYFDTTEQTIKTYNGNIWYDVAGPKELIDHQHYAGEGYVKHADYGNYVEFGNYIVSMDGGTASSNYSSAPNNDIIDGGNSQQMAIRIQLRRDTAANWVSNNPTLREGEIGIETDTLKFKIGNGSSTWTSITNYANVTPSGLTNSLSDYILVADQGNPGGPAELDSNGDLIIPENAIILWNDAAYDYTTTLAATQPTANRTITFPNSTGTVALTSDLTPYAPLAGATFTGNIQVPTAITFEGATADSYETTVQATDPTADRTITIPDITGTIVTTGDTGTVTNTMLAGSIANNKLANSSVTINGYEIALGASASYGTDNIGEGTTNLYFTNERAQDAVAQALANGTHTNITVSYSDNDNAISLTGAQTYNDEMARDAIGAALTGGSGITVTPNDNADTITVAVDSSIATKTYADNAVSTGISNLIASAPSALDTLNELAAALGNDANFSTTVTNALAGKQDKVTGVSDTEISYLDGVTSAIQTQIDAKAPSASPTITGHATIEGVTATGATGTGKFVFDNSPTGSFCNSLTSPFSQSSNL